MKNCSMYLVMVSAVFCHTSEKEHELSIINVKEISEMRTKIDRLEKSHDMLVGPKYRALKQKIEKQTL